MKRLLTFLLSAFAVSAWGATGDVTACNVRDDGWSVDVVFEGYNTNCTYSFGLGTNNSVTTSTKMVLTVFSPGFDDTGTSNWTSRLVYGTTAVRSNYPNQLAKDERRDATLAFVTNRIALSDYIYIGDSVTPAIASGLYSNSAAFSGSVVNNSTKIWPRVIGNWFWPGWNTITNRGDSRYTVRAMAFHASAQNFRPVRVMKFWAVDSSGNSTHTNFVTNPSIDWTMPDPSRVTEYVTDLYYTNLTQGAIVSNYFVAYPWNGVLSSIVNCADGANTPLSPAYAPLRMVCNNTGAYSTAVACVAPDGNDATGIATTNFNAASPPLAFLTIARAANAIRGTNNTHFGHDDVGGGVILLTNGGFNYVGGSSSYGSTPNAFITIKPFPGVARANVLITNTSGNTDISDRVKIENVVISTAGVAPFTSCEFLWFDQCEFTNITAAATIGSGCGVFLTHCRVRSFNQGLGPFGTQNTYFSLVRGNDLSDLEKTCTIFTFIGNVRSNNMATSTTFIRQDQNGGTFPRSTNWIVAFNRLYGHKATASTFAVFHQNTNNPNGGALVQNVFEQFDAFTAGMVALNADSTTNSSPVNNILVWKNTILAGKFLLPYNSSGSLLVECNNVQWKDTYHDIYPAVKADTFGTANAARVGNWQILYAVGSSGNYHLNGTNSVSSSPTDLDFAGLNSRVGNGTQLFSSVNFVSRQSWTGSASGAGNGYYTTLSLSPIVGWQTSALMPFDIEGVHRSGYDQPGAYSSASPRKGDFIGL